MKTENCALAGLLVVEPDLFGDERGFFLELWHQRRLEEHGVREPFVQDNISLSRRGTLRGLHYQNPHAQGKLITVLDGEVFDVAVDLRRSSATFKQWHGLVLSGRSKRQFYIPPGFAHGFLVLSETALFHYKCTGFYSPADEVTLRWDDPELGIAWGIKDPVLSGKDKRGFLLKDLPPEKFFD